MMKRMTMIMVSVSMLVGGFLVAPLAAAQGVPEPEDTQARTAANLVNQVSAANFKAVAEHPATYNNILGQAAVSAASTMLQSNAASFGRRQAIADAALAVSLKSFNTMDPKESLSLAKGMSSDLSAQIVQMLSAINAGGASARSQTNIPAGVTGATGQ